MKLTIISNPISGKKRHREYLKVVLEVLKSHGIHPELRETRKRGDACQFAREEVEKGSEIVVAAGGDGTLNEVANGLVGSPVKLGVLPIGTANVFALEADIPLDPLSATDIILGGVSRSITLGHITYRDTAVNATRENHFLMMAGIGFDGGVLHEIKRDNITQWGKAAYFAAGLRVLLQYRSVPLTITIDKREKVCGYSVIAANGRYYGGKFRVAPEASITDRFLDLCIIKRKGRLGVVKTALRVIRGNHPTGDDIHYCKAITAEIDSPEQVYVQADGDFLGAVPLFLAAKEHALSVVVPKTNSVRSLRNP
jgi:YegS/Rv2252/BmrU family lipid kinase